MSCKYSVFLPGLYFSCRKGAGTVQCPWVSAGYLSCSCSLALLVFRHFRLVQILTQQWIFGVVHIIQHLCQDPSKDVKWMWGETRRKFSSSWDFQVKGLQPNRIQLKLNKSCGNRAQGSKYSKAQAEVGSHLH